MSKIMRILTIPEERARAVRQLGVAGIVVGTIATALLCFVAVSGQM